MVTSHKNIYKKQKKNKSKRKNNNTHFDANNENLHKMCDFALGLFAECLKMQLIFGRILVEKRMAETAF